MSRKIIVIKTDRVGDLIYLSPCLKNIKDNNKESSITLVCSKYNHQIAKNYKFIDKFIIIDDSLYLFTLLRNFRDFFLTKYTFLFQFDGKSKSYLISYFIRAGKKSTICFIKWKKIFNFSYRVFRPRKFFLKLFFDNFLFCDEKYAHDDNRSHYQNLYFNILEKINFQIYNKKNLFFLDIEYKNIYDSFFKNNIDNKYFLFHFDEKWNRCTQLDFEHSLNLIKKLSKKNKVVISTGIKDFKFLKLLKNMFITYDYNNKFSILNERKNNPICVVENLPLNLLAYFIKNSEKNISYHSGPIVHISPCFDKEIIDLIPKSKNDELDRWIPIVSKYKRINFEELNNDFINSLKI